MVFLWFYMQKLGTSNSNSIILNIHSHTAQKLLNFSHPTQTLEYSCYSKNKQTL